MQKYAMIIIFTVIIKLRCAIQYQKWQSMRYAPQIRALDKISIYNIKNQLIFIEMTNWGVKYFPKTAVSYIWIEEKANE